MAVLSLRVFNREEIALEVQERREQGKGPVGRLRREAGMLPGVLYGHGQTPQLFKVQTRALERALIQGGQNAIFLVHFDGRESQRAVVRDIQYHKVQGNILHVDLLRIDPEEKLRLSVPLVTTGVPVGVRLGGGALQHSLTTLDMECMASDLPARVEVDISALELGESLHVGDLLEHEKRIVADAGVAILSVLVPRLASEEGAQEEEEKDAEEEGDAEGAGGEGEGAGKEAAE